MLLKAIQGYRMGRRGEKEEEKQELTCLYTIKKDPKTLHLFPDPMNAGSNQSLLVNISDPLSRPSQVLNSDYTG